MKLYEINAAILDCIDMETGEVLDAEKLDQLQIAKEEKIENVALWIKDLKAEAEALKAEKMAFAERQKAAENKAESLKNWLAYSLNGESFKTAKCAVSFRNSESVEVTDLDALIKYDDDLVKYAEPTPDKAKIKAALKDGIPVAGAELKSNTSVIIK